MSTNPTTRPTEEPRPNVAIIGAGISGLICARSLSDHGVEVSVFEKSRGVGGRMATRRTAEGPRFDHGAQYFTVRDARFERYVKSWTQDGIVAPWEGRICSLVDDRPQWKESTTPRFVGVPGMSSICRHLAADLNIQFSTQVSHRNKRKTFGVSAMSTTDTWVNLTASFRQPRRRNRPNYLGQRLICNRRRS